MRPKNELADLLIVAVEQPSSRPGHRRDEEGRGRGNDDPLRHERHRQRGAHRRGLRERRGARCAWSSGSTPYGMETASTTRTRGGLLRAEAKNPELTDRVRRIEEFFDRAGIACVIPPDMIRSLWFKYMVNVGVNQTSAVLRANYGALQFLFRGPDLMDSAMREVIAIAGAIKVEWQKDVGEWYKVLDGLNPEGKPTCSRMSRPAARSGSGNVCNRSMSWGSATVWRPR